MPEVRVVQSFKSRWLMCTYFFKINWENVLQAFEWAHCSHPAFINLTSDQYTVDLSLGQFPGGSDGKGSTCNAEDLGSIPESGKSPGEGNGNSLEYPGLENSMDRGAWRATVHGVAKSETRLREQQKWFLCITSYQMANMIEMNSFNICLMFCWKNYCNSKITE